MKNSVFKAYSKKMLRNEALVSVISVFFLAISIIGFSYALYMDVDTDDEYNLINIGDLAISFDNGDNTINLNNMTPTEDEVAVSKIDNVFSFYIYNVGNYTANYNIKLVGLEENEVDLKYINYQFCKDNGTNCEEIKTLSDIKDGIVYEDVLSPKKGSDETNPSVYYFLRIWINNKYISTESKNIKLKVVVDAVSNSNNLDNEKTLSGKVLKNDNIVINNNAPDLSKIETTEAGLFKTKDNYGTSYYFRGKSSYNYVKFAEMCFRIVRIEGDGAVKLILQDKDGICTNANYNIGSTGFGNESLYDDFYELLKDYEESMKETYWCKKDRNEISLECEANDSEISYVNAISKDELVFAGSLDSYKNNEAYLKGDYWSNTNYYYMTGDGVIEKNNNKELANRPMIVLKNDVLVTSGEGTANKPYVIES